MLAYINFYLVPGIVIGSVYAFSAIGITLVFSIMRHAHLAHGDMATIGAYFALAIAGYLALPMFVGLLLAIPLTVVLAVGTDWLCYGHLRSKPKIFTTIASLGVALMLRSLVQMIWGVNTTSYTRGINRPNDWFGFMIKDTELITVAALIIVVSCLVSFLNRTKWGKAMRAMSDNRDLALLSGVDNARVIGLTWSIVGALCTISGFFLGLNTELTPIMGWNIILPAFAAAILGGVGSVEGALIGGLIVGVVEECSVLVIPTEYKAISGFAILLVVLTLRPRGLFNGKVL